MKTYSTLEIAAFVLKNFGIQTEVRPLPGELDFNFFLQAPDGRSFILKIANAREKRGCIELQNAVMHHLSLKDVGLQVSAVVKAINGNDIVEMADGSSQPRMTRLLTWVDGRPWATVVPHSAALLEQLGEMCGKLCQALADFDHAEAHRFMKWDPSQAAWIKPHLHLAAGERGEWVHYFYTLFEQRVVPMLPALRMSVNYNDANDYNVLVSNDPANPRVPGVIDFGDVVYTHTVNELAIAIAYAAMGKNDPLETACHVVKGFNDVYPLTDEELSVIFPLVAARLLISVTCAALNRVEHPDNGYLQISDNPAWDLLEKFRAISPELAYYAFRNACHKEACTKHDKFVRWASSHYKAMNFPVKNGKKVMWLDLGVGSLEVGNSQNLHDSDLLDKQVRNVMTDADASLAIGRYDEARAFYTTDAFATIGNDSQTWRTVHIGMDFFTQQPAEVFAVCDGTVHSFANNAADRDYGPTIILEHSVADDLVFYTLYGHLSTDSLTAMTVGKVVRRGDVIGHVGARHENGNWPTHLHFQIVLDMLGKQGDFPGVAYAPQRSLWKSICPDPWLLLTGKASDAPAILSSQSIVDYRKEHLGKNMSISYREPIKMVSGSGVHLQDDTGRRYLDTVNNVAHVGHEHPRVVRAGQRQMAVLNTNTRYLHDNIVKFVEAMLETMPPQLDVAFIVNSGSEANELGMRLARNYTGQKDMIVSEVGYHGNTGGCIEISSYKFDGAGGKGAAPHVHVVPIPDVYRGLYRANDPHAGSKYAGHVKQAIANMQAQGRNPAAFIFESVISCGGQVELPENFLKQAYQHVRDAGGVCLADEVQTGCGRAGDHFWAFQQHDVVPDIVTIGKPIGNGHPLAVVVTTQAIANAFKNGMEYFNTFGGNPVSCAIGLEVLKVIREEGLQQNAKTVGNYLKAGLRNLMDQFPIVGDVRGPGLFIGFELVKDRVAKTPATEQAAYFANRMRDKGILMSTDGPFNNVLKIKPPLVFSSANADFLLDAIRSVLREDVMRVQ
jgi:4-aminobutyrate aminotransferase-like enzyme/Ser/Thr protein kinase RdoA (MazF antagonist)